MKTRATQLITVIFLTVLFSLLTFQAISAGDGSRCSGGCVQVEVPPPSDR